MNSFRVDEGFSQKEYPFHSWEYKMGYWYYARIDETEIFPVKGNLQAATVSSIIACATKSRFTAEDFPVSICNGRSTLKAISLIDCLRDKNGACGYIWRISRTSRSTFQIIVIVTDGEIWLLELNSPQFDINRRMRLPATATMRHAIAHNLISVNDAGILTHVEVSHGALCIHRDAEIACRVSGSLEFRWIRDFSCVSDGVGILLTEDSNGRRKILVFDLNSGETIAVRQCDSVHPIGLSGDFVIFRDRGCILVSSITLESPQVIGQLSVSESMVDKLPVNSDLSFASSDDGRFVGICMYTRSRSPLWITYDLKMDSFFRTGSPTDRILF